MDYYLAQIAAEIRLGNTGKTVRLRDFLIDAGAERSKRMQNSKRLWSAALGLKLEKN